MQKWRLFFRSNQSVMNEETQLRVHEIFHPLFKFMFSSVGVSFEKRKVHHCIIIGYLVLKSIAVFIGCFLAQDSTFDIFSFISAAGSYLAPSMTYILVSYRLRRINDNIDVFLNQSRITLTRSSPVVRKMRNMNIISLILTALEWTAHLTLGYISLLPAKSWVVQSSLMFDFNVNRQIKLTLAYIIHVYTSLTLCYIAKTTFLYLSYLFLLMEIKSHLLDVIQTQRIADYDSLLNSLDALTDVFESSFSFMPFLWLLYCSGPGLCFILAHLKEKNPSHPHRLSTRIYLAVHVCNILILLLILFIISRWQEDMNSRVVACNRRIRSGICPPLCHRLQKRLAQVMARNTTVWFILPIDRCLILSYIGSAISFSTLFIQLKEQIIPVSVASWDLIIIESPA